MQPFDLYDGRTNKNKRVISLSIKMQYIYIKPLHDSNVATYWEIVLLELHKLIYNYSIRSKWLFEVSGYSL